MLNKGKLHDESDNPPEHVLIEFPFSCSLVRLLHKFRLLRLAWPNQG